MRTLYDNAFSPFARKVRMVLEHKGLAFEGVDALAPERRDALAKVNPRLEVPVLDDDGLVIVNSADIVAYLEQRHPERPVYPADAAERVRALPRCLLYTSPSPRDISGSRMPSSA